MPRNDFEISLLTKMWKKGAIGMNYRPIQKLMGGIPKDQRDKAKKALDNLVQDGIVAYREGKGEKLAAILSDQVETVRDILSDEVPSYVLELR